MKTLKATQKIISCRTFGFLVLLFVISVSVIGCAPDEEPAPPAASAENISVPVIEFEDMTEDIPASDIQPDGENHEDADNNAGEESFEEETEDEKVPAAEDSFYAEEISDAIFARMEGKSFPEECTTKREDLRYLHLLYKDLDGNAHEGEMVCNVIIADKLISIFRQLYENDYPIERMRLIDDYDADDEMSMRDNNTSCFNFRYVSGTNSISKHGLGLAVDLNPFYNPSIHVIDGETLTEPEGSDPYADRTADFDYKIDKDDLAYRLFIQEGFTWGGSWKNSKDYQHFQK